MESSVPMNDRAGKFDEQQDNLPFTESVFCSLVASGFFVLIDNLQVRNQNYCNSYSDLKIFKFHQFVYYVFV